jgi:hypothetical protein
MNEITKPKDLVALIEQAAAALSKATTAAEVLDAKRMASATYAAVKDFARHKSAHDEVLAACRQAMADAIDIEHHASCRLAEEYDAAQARGDVKGHGNKKKSEVSKENLTPTLKDIGLTKKQVFEARAELAAEKANPGFVRKLVDDQVLAGKEPTKAAVKRAIKPKVAGPQPHRRKVSPEAESAAAALVLDQGKTYDQAATEAGLTLQLVRAAVQREEGRRAGLATVGREDLSLSAQQKLDAALRRYQNELNARFEQRVLDEVRRRMDDIVLPHWKKQIEEAKGLYAKRKALMAKDTFNTIRRALHPDSRNSISDKKLGEAFDTFMGLEKYLLDEKDSPTPFGDLPSSAAEWEKMRTRKNKQPVQAGGLRRR